MALQQIETHHSGNLGASQISNYIACRLGRLMIKPYPKSRRMTSSQRKLVKLSNIHALQNGALRKAIVSGQNVTPLFGLTGHKLAKDKTRFWKGERYFARQYFKRHGEVLDLRKPEHKTVISRRDERKESGVQWTLER